MEITFNMNLAFADFIKLRKAGGLGNTLAHNDVIKWELEGDKPAINWWLSDQPVVIDWDKIKEACVITNKNDPPKMRNLGFKKRELLREFFNLTTFKDLRQEKTIPVPTAVKSMEEDILEEALRITSGDRQAQYGPPDQDFARTAKMWSALKGIEFEARDVAMFMICLKLSREIHQRKRDNSVDGAGYFRCLHICNQVALTEKDQ